jgi:protein with PEP-CTERM/exosortase system signal
MSSQLNKPNKRGMAMKRLALICLLVGSFSALPAVAKADTVTFDLNYVFSGFVPASAPGYLTATFDCPTSTSCTLTLTSSLENVNEFLTEVDFNSSTALGSNAISFTSCVTCGAPAIDQYSSNAYQADGDGLYDFGFLFQSANAQRFDDSDIAIFTITGTGLTATQFNVLSSPAGGSGPFYAAAHVQGIPGGCSGWVADANGGNVAGGGGVATGVGTCGGTVPDSGTSLQLLGLAMLGLGYLRRRLA